MPAPSVAKSVSTMLLPPPPVMTCQPPFVPSTLTSAQPTQGALVAMIERMVALLPPPPPPAAPRPGRPTAGRSARCSSPWPSSRAH